MRGQSIVQAKVFGEYDGREYEFMVDTGFSFLVLPQEEIEALGLRRARGTVKLVSATGLVDVATYQAGVRRHSRCLRLRPCRTMSCCKT